MKKPIRIAVLLVALVTSLFVFAACKTGSGKDKTNVDGKYYLYEDGALNKSEYFDLSDGVWRDEDGASGTYAFTDGTIVFYTELFGENSELCSGNISEGTLTITVGGITKNYRTDNGDLPYEEGTKLETPVLSVSVDTVKWDAVAGAKKYVLTVDGTENELDVSACSFTIENISVGEHSVSLVAKAEKNRYDSDSAGMRFDFDLFASGSGTFDNPYGIANAAHLANIAVFPDKNYVVKRDNDFSDAVLAVEMPAVDDKKVEFSGSIKAEKDAVIDGAKIDRTLFDLGENAVIDGLVLKNIVSTKNSSPLFGLNKGNIVNSSLEGEFTGYYSAVNPIFVRSNKGIIKNCSFGGDMTGFVTAVGENSGTIEAFRSSVTLTADNTKLDKSPCSLKFGLVCSYNVGTIKNAAVTGVFTFNLVYEGFVLGTSSEAAIASVVGENYGIIEKSLSSVDIGGTIYDKYDRINVGGFVGKTNVVNDTVSSVSDCSYNGTLSLIVDNQSGIMIAGGFVGNAFKGDISHSGVERQVTVNGRTFDPSFIGWSIASGKYGGFAGANFDASIADSYAVGLNIVGEIGEARYADFAITLNSGTNTSCFTAASDEILLDEDHWFIPRNGSPKVLAVSDVGAIEGVCEFTKNKNVLSWNAVPDAEYYEYEFYGRTYFTDKTSVTLEFTRGGDTIVKVRPCSDSRLDGEWRQTTFDVKTLDFAVEKGGKTENITFYIVVGNMYTVADFGCEREGYTFIGWLCGGEYAAGDEITVTSDMTFVPKFEINEYRLTVYMQKRSYDGRGLDYYLADDKQVTFGESLGLPVPVLSGFDKAGYNFDGWFVSDRYFNDATRFDSDAMPARDLSLWVKFTLKTFNVKLNPNYDGATVETHVRNYNFTVRVADFGTLQRKGYTFLGWHTIEERAKLKTPTKEGYEFSGWYSDSGFTKVVYQWTIAYTADTCNGYTVYACFMKLYRVTHVMPDFAPQVPEKLVSGYSYTLGKLPDVEGYKAIGWCSDEALTNIITYVRLTGDVKVYAYYEKYHHAVFETGNGTPDGEYDCKYTKLDTFDVSDIKANPPKNYIFTGWKISDGDGEVITEIPLGTDRDVTLVAVYEHATEGLIYTLNSDKKSYSVTFPGSADDLGETEDVAIRAYYNGLPVTKIAASTGEYHINKLIIPYGITEICSKAFFGRTFDYVYIPSSVTTLGTKAFFVIEQSLNMCPKHYFNIAYGGEKLPENTADKWWNVGYEETGTYVKQEYWYSPILNVKRYVFSPDEDNVEFNDGTFGIVKDRCGKTFVDLENRTEKITYIAPFAYGGSIYEIRIPEGCTVDRSAFYNCVDMRAVTSKTEFDLARAFGTIIDRQYSGSLDLTYDVKHITLSASATCVKSLTLIGTETIVDSAFSGWSKLEEVNLPDTLTGVGTGIFEKAIISKAVVPGIALECLSKDYLTDLTITGGDIPASAFQGYKLLVSVKFGNDVKTVGDQAFADCPALTGIYTDSIESWCDIDFATKDANPLAYAGYLYVGGGQVVDLVIDGVVDEIKPYAFYGIKIDSLILSDVGTIGESAFEKSRLKTLTVKEGVVNIGKWAFIYCTSLTDVSLSDSVREIGYAAFSHCNNLINLDLGNGVAVIGQSAFAWSYNLTTVVLGDGVTTIGEGAFTSARVVRFGKNIKTIDANAFRAAYSSVVKEIHIVDLASWCSVNMTGAIAFNINTTLYVDDEPITSLVIPDEVTRISDFVFAGLNITEVNIHRGVRFIGKMAFMRCIDLTSVNFDGTVEEWNNIEKTDDWDDYAGEYTVHCKDGDIAPAESA